MQGFMADLQRYRAISGERNFIGQNKASIFLKTFLAKEIKQDNPIWKKKFFSTAT